MNRPPNRQILGLTFWGRFKIIYMNLLTSEKLNDYLVDIENQAENMFFQIVKQLAESDNITEELKAKDQM